MTWNSPMPSVSRGTPFRRGRRQIIEALVNAYPVDPGRSLERLRPSTPPRRLARTSTEGLPSKCDVVKLWSTARSNDGIFDGVPGLLVEGRRAHHPSKTQTAHRTGVSRRLRSVVQG